MNDEQGLMSVTSKILGGDSKAATSPERLLINQSAWKKELENHIYNQKKELGFKQNQPEKVSNVFDHHSGSHASSLLAMKSAEVDVEANALMSQSDISKTVSMPGSYFATLGLDDSKKGKIASHLSNVPVASYVEHQNGQKPTLKISTSSAHNSEGLSKTDPKLKAYDIKPFSIKLLANGELLIRNYNQGNLSKAQLDDVVKEIKRIFNNDFQKLIMNGEVVWEASKSQLENNYIIELIY